MKFKLKIQLIMLSLVLTSILSHSSETEPFRFLGECKISGGLGLTGNSYYPEFELYQNTKISNEGFFIGRNLLIMGRKNIAESSKVTETWSRKMFALSLIRESEIDLITDVGAKVQKWKNGGFKIRFRNGEKYFSNDFQEFSFPDGVNRFQIIWGAHQYFCSTVQ